MTIPLTLDRKRAAIERAEARVQLCRYKVRIAEREISQAASRRAACVADLNAAMDKLDKLKREHGCQ